MKKISIAVVSCLACMPCAMAAVPNDFDGDGISDRTWVQIGNDKSLTWTAELSTSQAQMALGSLGKAGDAITMAQWLPGGTQIGVASLNGSTNKIEWSIRESNGNVRTKVFGKKGDLVISGADFDGNGIADAAVARLVNKKATWEVMLNFFASDTPVKKTFTFGGAGDRIFYARAAKDSAVDWVGITRTGSNSKTLARMRDINSGAVKQFPRLPQLASQGVRPRPFPVRQSAGTDLIGFSVGSGGKTSLKVFNLQGGAVFSHVFSGTGTSVVGEFLQGPGEEVAYESGEYAAIANPRQIDVTETVALGGIPVDEVNINSLGAEVPTPTPTSTPSGDDGGTNGRPAQCSQFVSMPSTHIYKTFGSNHFSDIRRKTIGLIMKSGAQGPFPSCIDAIDTKGNVVSKLALYAVGGGWGARYYAGIRCAKSTPFGGAEVASRAMQSSGSSRIYMKFGNVCYGPFEANKCINSSSC